MLGTQSLDSQKKMGKKGVILMTKVFFDPYTKYFAYENVTGVDFKNPDTDAGKKHIWISRK